MKKIDIINKLKELELDKDKVIIISGASLVMQDVIDETSDIDLSCSLKYYKSINWDTKIGAFNVEIKYRDCFEIGSNIYYPKDYIKIDDYKFMTLKKCLEIKEELHREKDKEVIEKLKSIL